MSAEPLDFNKLDAFAVDVLAGLGAPKQKSIPCHHLYDARGNELFEAIIEQPEYYLSRTEIGILEAHAADIVAGMPPGSVLVEFGSGSSWKTEILLDAVVRLAAYVPIDVSASALAGARHRLAARFPGLRVEPLLSDFRHPLQLPAEVATLPRTGFFPGSTIGNFSPDEAKKLLGSMANVLGTGSRLIIGVDLLKSPKIMVPAYDDAAGFGAIFIRNLLMRANRELGADFDPDAFYHEARFNEVENRIEVHLVSKRAQIAHVLGRSFAFQPGETIHMQNSYKHTVKGFQALTREAGWTPHRVWTDNAGLFSVHELINRTPKTTV